MLDTSCRKGSIPVHTGKPDHAFCYCHINQGLSPYTRGNHFLGLGLAYLGSIPVHTGKPFPLGEHQPGPYNDTFGVYPRTHGETSHMRRKGFEGLSPYTRGNHIIGESLKALGLSPYTRGNLRHLRCCPGKPHSQWKLTRVYPRTHGETCTNVYFFLPRK